LGRGHWSEKGLFLSVQESGTVTSWHTAASETPFTVRCVLKLVLFFSCGCGKERFGNDVNGMCQEQVTAWMKNSEITRIIYRMLG